MRADQNRRRTTIRLSAFAALLAAVFAAAAFAGSKVAPEVDTEHGEDMDGMPASETPAHDSEAATAELPGLAVSASGYRLVADQTRLGADCAKQVDAGPEPTRRQDVVGPEVVVGRTGAEDQVHPGTIPTLARVTIRRWIYGSCSSSSWWP